MDLTGAINFSPNERILFMVSLACWLGLYGYIGYIVGNKKVKHVALSMVLAWYASFMNTVPIFVSLYLGKPKKFEVIHLRIRLQKVDKEGVSAKQYIIQAQAVPYQINHVKTRSTGGAHPKVMYAVMASLMTVLVIDLLIGNVAVICG